MATDYSSIYSIEEHILNEIAPQYFEVQDVSLLSVGLLGMIIDTMGSSIEDQFDATAKFLNEQLVSQASLPEFIYAHAASYGVTNVFSTAAKMPIGLTIKERDILSNAVDKGSYFEFVIDAKLRMTIDDTTTNSSTDMDDVPYSIPYNIVIHTTKYKGEYSHIAYYDTTYKNDVVRGITTKYLKLMRWFDGFDSLIYIKTDAYQYERVITEVPIITNNKLNIPYADIRYKDQLCNFEVFYVDKNGKKTQLQKRMGNQPAITSPFVYYECLNDDTIRFKFANDDRYWLPDYNSTLEVHMFETKGELGNFDWGIENIRINCAGNSSDELLAYNRKIYIDGFVTNASVGGVKQSSLEQIRADTQEKMITIDSYTTDADLNLHFLNYAKKHRVTARFVKHRDDIAGRIYGCFSRIGNGTDIYPTNTLDIRLQTYEADDRFDALYQFIVKAGRLWKYDGESLLSLIPVDKDEDISKLDIIYINLQLMVISLEANSIRFYMNSVSKMATLSFIYMNVSSIFTFMATKFWINRDATRTSNYSLSITLTRTDGIKVVDKDGVQTIYAVDPTKIHVLLIFDTPDGHYMPMKFMSVSDDNVDFQFTCEINTDDMIDNGRIRLNNLKLRETGEDHVQMVNMQDPKMKICIFYDHEDGVGNNGGHGYVDIEEVANSTLCNEYSPDEGEFYFAYPLSLMRSHVIFEDNPLSDDGYNFLLKQVPMIGYPFFSENMGNAIDVVNSIINLHQIVTDMVPKMTQMYTATIKFYNTYGRSRMFYLADGKTLLNRVNSDLDISIKFKDGIIPEDYINAIRIYAKEYIESSNVEFDDAGVNEMLISVLIHDLHEHFADQIHYIIFNSFNNYDTSVQTIQTTEKIDGTTDPTMIPEYLTIRVKDVKITIL